MLRLAGGPFYDDSGAERTVSRASRRASPGRIPNAPARPTTGIRAGHPLERERLPRPLRLLDDAGSCRCHDAEDGAIAEIRRL